MWDRGWWTIFRSRATPVRLHWSLPLSALLVSRFRFEPAIWLGFVVLVLVHELGHAVLVSRYQLEVESIDLHGMGGECRYRGDPSAWQIAVIAWGGVLAQALLLPLGFLLAPTIDQPFLATCIETFGWANVWMIAFNLMPIPPLDGAEAWKAVSIWRSSRREQRTYQKARERLQREKRRVAKVTDDTSRLLREIERHDEVPSELDLPNDVANQVERAMQRARDDHREQK
jgi:hypothetical protein